MPSSFALLEPLSPEVCQPGRAQCPSEECKRSWDRYDVGASRSFVTALVPIKELASHLNEKLSLDIEVGKTKVFMKAFVPRATKPGSPEYYSGSPG